MSSDLSKHSTVAAWKVAAAGSGVTSAVTGRLFSHSIGKRQLKGDTIGRRQLKEDSIVKRQMKGRILSELHVQRLY